MKVSQPKEVAERSPDVLLSRHDNHNLELKLHIELPPGKLKSKLDVYLFFPHNLDPAMFTKNDLLSDFRARSRLAVVDNPNAGVDEIQRRLSELEITLRSLKANDWLIQRQVQWLGAVVGERMKMEGHQFRRNSLLFCALFSRPVEQPSALESRLSEGLSTVSRLRSSVRQIAENHSANTWVQILDRYCHQAYIGFWGRVEESLRLYQERPHVAQQMEFRMRSELRKESEHARRFLTQDARNPSDKLNDLGQMKKFFQSALFVDVQKRPGRIRLQESAALAGTAVAGVAAAGAQMLSENWGLHLTASSTALFFLGVFFYVFRDRMKDWARDHLNQRAEAMVPDVEQVMTVGGREVGRADERLRVLPDAKLSPEVLKLRKNATQSLVDRTLNEDVIHYEYIQECSEPLHAHLQDSVRINLHRYLKFMDDPMKEMTVLQDDGSLLRQQVAKVYHLWAILEHKVIQGPSEILQRQVYRIEVTKGGIQRVDLAS